MDAEDLLRELGGRVVYSWVEEPVEPRPGPRVGDAGLCSLLVENLVNSGITRLYEFQYRALEMVREGRSLVIVSGTGSGKTEAFLLPIIDDVCRGRAAGVRAMIVYPTKALTSDQHRRVERYTAGMLGVRSEVYDGDTPVKVRRRIYEDPPQILLTNPDMLHFSLSNPRFRSAIGGLRYVVFDDLHVYNGVFGTHVAYIVRRLRRVVGDDVVFIGASATVGSPREFASKLFGVDVEVLDLGPGRRFPVLHAMIYVEEGSRYSEAVGVARRLVERGMKTLIFTDSHRSAEVLALMARRAGLRFYVHRAGLSREERRRVERMFKRGEIGGVVATPTLELGIDIGDLDAVVMLGVPPSYTRYVQRSGRCGRAGPGYVFLIMGGDPISSYYRARPQEYYFREPEIPPLDLSNEEVARRHVLAMAVDTPIRSREVEGWMRPYLEDLERRGLLRMWRGQWFATRDGRRMFYRMSIRGVGERVAIIHEGREIGYRELPMALRELHPDAIYLHGGRVYRVLRLSLRGYPKYAEVERLPDDYGFYTVPLYTSIPRDFKPISSREVYGVTVVYGSVDLEMVVEGYVRKRVGGGKVSETVFARPESYVFRTKALYFTMPVREDWGDMENAEAFHAIEHTVISAASIVVGAGQTDLGGVSFPTGLIVIYDSVEGGSGVAKLLYEKLEEALAVALQIVSSCTCEDGCPKCIYSPYCGNNNQILSRRKAAAVLSEVVKGAGAVYPARFIVAGRPIA